MFVMAAVLQLSKVKEKLSAYVKRTENVAPCTEKTIFPFPFTFIGI